MRKLKKKIVSNRFILIILAFFMFALTVGVGAINVGYSAEVSNTTAINGCTLTYDSDYGVFNTNENSLTITIIGTTDEGLCGDEDNRKQTNVKITYNGTAEAKFSFQYNFTKGDGNGAQCIIDDTNIDSGNNQNYQIPNFQNKKTIDIIVNSGDGSSSTSTLKLYNFNNVIKAESELTLLIPDNGYYTFSDSNNDLITINNESTENVLINSTADIEFTLEAFPNDGYEFFGWYFQEDGKEMSLKSTLNPLKTTSLSASIKPMFVIEGEAIFKNENKYFFDLNDAINNAKNNSSNDKIVILDKSGALPSNTEYTLSDGVMLYIPNNEFVTVYEGKDVVTNNTSFTSQTTEYRVLTLKENTKISVDNSSSIYIANICKATSNAETGYGVGQYGHINLSTESSELIFNTGSKLYCYGYVTGAGTVTANSGSIVYEFFQMADWKGGTISAFTMMGNSEKVFLINQYYVQNIECNFKIHYNAKDIILTGIEASSKLAQAEATFIGNDGIFNITDTNGYIIRKYNYANDIISYNVYGNASLSSISLDLSFGFSLNIKSADYVLPICNNLKINVKSGSEIKIDQDVCLLPGSSLTIEEGAELVFSDETNLYIYDNDSWYGQGFVHSGVDLRDVRFSATLKKRPSIRKLTSSSPDAEININGTVSVNSNAGLYTTISKSSSGEFLGAANIHSSNKTGKIIFLGQLGSQNTTYQFNNNKSPKFVSIPIEPAYLKNGENASTEYFIPSSVSGGVTNKQIVFDSITDSWNLEELVTIKKSIKFIDPINNVSVESTYTVGQPFSFPYAADLNFEYNNYEIKKREIELLGTFEPGETIDVMGNYGDIEAIAIWGGRYSDNDNYYYIDYETGENITGLYKVKNYNDGNVYIHLFNEDGSFASTFTGLYKNNVYNTTYYIEFGIVQENKGLIKYKENPLDEIYEYIYIQSDNSLLTSIDNYYIDTNLNNLLPSGYYSFDSNGYIKRDDLDTTNYDGEPYIKDYVTYIDGIKVSCGLFTYQNYYYYSNINCEIVRDTTFYVSKTNNLGISEGLYYFDGQGRMYDQNFKLIEVKQDETK